MSHLARSQLADHHAVRTVVLDGGHPILHAGENTLDMATSVVQGADLVVTIP